MNQEIKETIKLFLPISLVDMDEVSLMNRSDTKFIVPQNIVSEILTAMQNKYNVLEVGKNRIMTYNSLYYDTSENMFYKWHHNGKKNRIKVRIRNYVESKIHFLEVKRKKSNGTTKKDRISIDGFEEHLSENSNRFIQEITNRDLNLSPTLENRFNRITLVSKQFKERATIDFNLSFNNKSKSKTFENLAIIEIKQEGVNRSSPIYSELKTRHILPNSISKYCLGMVSLYNNLKYNTFKYQLLQIQKLTA